MYVRRWIEITSRFKNFKEMNRFCYSDGARARLRIPVGELNDLAGSRRNLHLRGEQPRWIPGESFLLRERRSLWRRQGPGNYFTINLCPPVMDYLIYYYYLLLLLLFYFGAFSTKKASARLRRETTAPQWVPIAYTPTFLRFFLDFVTHTMKNTHTRTRTRGSCKANVNHC